jgi:hypothetical protein
MTEKKDWEILLSEAIASLRIAHEAMHDIADWTGSCGNWPLHENMPKVDQALAILEPPVIPNKMSKEEVI